MTGVRKTLIPAVTNQVLVGEEKSPFTRIWFDFFVTLWERTGGPVDRFAENTPTGVITAFGGSTAPDGWLLCDGSAVSRTTQSVLFNVITTTWGAGDGSTTFNLPDFKGRGIIGAGAGASLTVRARGDTGGAEDITLATTNLPTHNHGVTDGGHTHGITDGGHTHGVTDGGHTHGVTDSGHNHSAAAGAFIVSSGAASYTAGSVGSPEGSTTTETTGVTVNNATTGITNNSGTTGVTNNSATTGIATVNTGSGTAKDVMNPFGCANYIIKT